MIPQEIRHAFRGLVRSPLLSLVVVVTMGLAIGATTMIYSVLHAVVLTSLPYEEPESLVMIWERNFPRDRLTNVVSPANFLEWREAATTFEGMAAVFPLSVTMTGQGEPLRLGAVRVTRGFFKILRTQAFLGRTPESEDYEAQNLVLLNHDFWRRQFGSDSEVLRRRITLQGEDVEIIGVLPPGFEIDLPYQFNSTGTQDLFLPFQFSPEARNASGRWLQVIASLRPSVSVNQAQAEMSAIAGRLEEEFPDRQSGWGVNVVPLHEQVIGEVRTPLFIIFGSVVILLVVACANVANLLLSRAVGRQQEWALRQVLGAGKLRLLRQSLIESIVLGLGGGMLGIFVTKALLSLLVVLAPDIPRLNEIRVDEQVLLFATFVSLLTGILFGMAPALRVTLLDTNEVLKEAGSRIISPGSSRARVGLVIAEVTLCLVLMASAGLLTRSFAKLLDVDLGFESEQLLTFELQLPGESYPNARARSPVFNQVVERIAAIPGIRGASAISFLPLAGAGSATDFYVNDRPVPEAGEFPVADVRPIHADYTKVMGIPLHEGRLFDSRDHADAPLRVLVSDFVAREFWPGQSALGKRISMPWGETLEAEIVGVVGDVRHYGPRQAPRSMLYWHHEQFSFASFMSIVARTEGDPFRYLPALREAVREIDPNLPIYRVRAMDDYVAGTLAQTRFTLVALGLFSAAALIMAAIGLYGVMTYSVAQRTREFGIRMALGAQAQQIVVSIVRRGLLWVGLAISLGIGISLALLRIMRGMVFGISTHDPVALLGATLFVMGVALVACYLPARRASRADPSEALRYE